MARLGEQVTMVADLGLEIDLGSEQPPCGHLLILASGFGELVLRRLPPGRPLVTESAAPTPACEGGRSRVSGAARPQKVIMHPEIVTGSPPRTEFPTRGSSQLPRKARTLLTRCTATVAVGQPPEPAVDWAG
jgi:hypothetical protein